MKETTRMIRGAASAIAVCAACAILPAKNGAAAEARQKDASAARSFCASVWRGETAYVEIPEAFRDMAPSLAGRNAGPDVSLTLLRFEEVQYDMVERAKNEKGKWYNKVGGKGSVPDVCREWKPGYKSKPTMVKVVASPGAKPVKRVFELEGPGGGHGSFELSVVDRVLPPAKHWKYFLDLWQHPWAVSRYFGVKPFSKEHYARMEPVWRALAESGCKALTVTLTSPAVVSAKDSVASSPEISLPAATSKESSTVLVTATFESPEISLPTATSRDSPAVSVPATFESPGISLPTATSRDSPAASVPAAFESPEISLPAATSRDSPAASFDRFLTSSPATASDRTSSDFCSSPSFEASSAAVSFPLTVAFSPLWNSVSSAKAVRNAYGWFAKMPSIRITERKMLRIFFAFAIAHSS